MDDKTKIVELKRDEWDRAYEIASEKYSDDLSVYVISEGAHQKDALLSSMTVAKEIEDFSKGEPLNLWLEVGTGMLAQACEIYFSLLSSNIKLHLIFMSSNESDYEASLEGFKKYTTLSVRFLFYE